MEAELAEELIRELQRAAKLLEEADRIMDGIAVAIRLGTISEDVPVPA